MIRCRSPSILATERHARYPEQVAQSRSHDPAERDLEGQWVAIMCEPVQRDISHPEKFGSEVSYGVMQELVKAS